MEWIKASERLPGNDEYRLVKIDGQPGCGNFFQETDYSILFHVDHSPTGGYDIPYSKFAGIEWLDESTPLPKEDNLTIENLFNNNSDCYADTWTVNPNNDTLPMIEGDIIPAMTKETFIKIISGYTHKK